LISNEIIAIQELIKNAYDADATYVSLTFEDPLLPGKGEIVIRDNGDGMTLETIRGAWMEPATVSKLQRKTTRNGRRVTGEKGIGRFAAARIARVMEIISVPRDLQQEISVRFDWGEFEDERRYLDEISCTWEARPAQPHTDHGTTLKLIALNDEWDETPQRGKTSFTNLRSELSRLVAPLSKDEFAIRLVLPERFGAFAGLISAPEVLERPHYKISGSIDDSGRLSATYEDPSGWEELTENGEKPFVLLSGGRPPSCGPFEFEFLVWDRQREDLEPLAKQFSSTIREIRRDLDASSGINVYRDRFRVLIPESDWVRLDLRRVQNPTLRLSNNQVVGRVFISADRNRGLKDQSNRQGIVDSPQLEDFKATLKEILSRLEVKRDKHRRESRPITSGTGLFEKLQIEPMKAFLLQRYPEDKGLLAYLDERTRTFDEGVGEMQQVLSRYRRLATLGQLIDVVLHEGRTPVSTIRNEIQLAKASLGMIASVDWQREFEKRLQVIIEQTDFLALLFKRLAPFSGRKRGRPTKTTIERLISDSFALFEKRALALGVSTNLPQSTNTVTADPAEMQMIFVNLIENALYWLEKVPTNKRAIAVEVHRSPAALEIMFSDSGPGISDEVRDRIFDPYFSTKPDGVGLGLTIAGETAAEYDGSLELLASGPHSGATFRVRLTKRLGLDDGD